MTLSSALNEALASSLTSVTKDWTAQKRHADRQQRVSARALENFRSRPREWTVKDAAYQVMREAYMKASANGRLWANARQIMYAARPLVMDLTGGKCWKNDSYFTQHLLIDYMHEHAGGWHVAFDDRGHFKEPHTGRTVGLGTLNVQDYLKSWKDKPKMDVPAIEDLFRGLERLKTNGPTDRFGAALFVEKEGFDQLLAEAQFEQRFDLAIMSTKGMSVTAARDLVTRLSSAGVTTYVLHDFDKAGFSILRTLHSSTRRYRFLGFPSVVDLGLRLADVAELDLASEPVDYDSGIDPRMNLRQSGATPAECDFLVQSGGWRGWSGQRVELNAMTSDQLVAWLEKKLETAGVKKVIPDQDTLAAAYRRARQILAMRKQLETVQLQLGPLDDVPNNLTQMLTDQLSQSTEAWDAAVWDLAAEDDTPGKEPEHA